MNRLAHRLEILPGRVLPRVGRPLRVRGRATDRLFDFASARALVDHHFSTRSSLDHYAYGSMLEAVERLQEEPSVILETGMSAWGCRSSELFDDYVSCFGGAFSTVDIRARPLLELRDIVGSRTELTCDDSVRFLERWVRSNPGRQVDLVYLDSFDLDPRSPYPAAVHGVREFLAVRPALGEGSLLLVDDTPIDTAACPPEWRDDAAAFLEHEGQMPGKGMVIVPYLDATPGVTKLQHGYQVLYRFDR